MSYMTVINMAESNSLRRRVYAAVAQEAANAGVRIASVEGWVSERMLTIAAASGWSEKWEYAVDTYTAAANPDTGARPDVINDADILAVVQPLVLELVPETPAE